LNKETKQKRKKNVKSENVNKKQKNLQKFKPNNFKNIIFNCKNATDQNKFVLFYFSLNVPNSQNSIFIEKLENDKQTKKIHS